MDNMDAQHMQRRYTTTYIDPRTFEHLRDDHVFTSPTRSGHMAACIDAIADDTTLWGPVTFLFAVVER